jgi:hypothetical protein
VNVGDSGGAGAWRQGDIGSVDLAFVTDAAQACGCRTVHGGHQGNMTALGVSG